MNGWVAVISAVGGILGTLGIGEIVKAWLGRRRPSNAERVKTLNEATLAWAEELKEDAANARKELGEVRHQAGEVFTELGQVRTRLYAVESQLYGMEQVMRRILHLVHHTPDMTLERLRELVPEAPRGGGL